MAKPLSPEQLAVLRMAPMLPSVVNRVRLACALTDTTLKQLMADMPGAHYQQVSSIARGRFSNMHIKTARPFAKFFGCTIDDLFPELPDERNEEEAA